METQKEQAALINGRAAAKAFRASVSAHVDALIKAHGIQPGLSVVLVGDDPASAIYVRDKEKKAQRAGINGQTHRLPKETSQDDLLALVKRLNADKDVHGILVQLPLPDHIDTDAVLAAIDPAKDVDGLHVQNIGLLAAGEPAMVPCTPMGCMILIRSVIKNLSGLHAVVVGRSKLAGKPVAELLLHENCTVTICHSRTHNPAHIARQADILVVAAGRPKMVKADWIKSGAVVIDVGINRLDDGTICGDVDFDEAVKVAGHITPVPGGVGPMTIACLLGNTLIAACRQTGVDVPHIG
ncbi:MAG: bifunctional methylenetetrahydrofolate dehydrogenase/methenyltetrahydrofolate cyclohydrolase FolD [Alphaproteobacteria bacterium]|nr:bifunctional methylenetetrahydrofolate dehydrogenase/methenyltetrahydrofolate cyclohydrolase FolD [Alphaproteobacteria bacterium]